MDRATGAPLGDGLVDAPPDESGPSRPVKARAAGEGAITTLDGRRLAVTLAVDPVMELGRMTVAGHRIEPVLSHAGSGEPLTAAERSGLLAIDMERADFMALRKAMARLDERRGDDPGLLIVSVSFFTVSSQRARTNLLTRSGALRDQMRHSVIWALADLPEGASAGRLSEVTALMRPFGRAVFARTRLGGTVIKTARAAGLSGLAIDPPADISPTDAALWLLQAGRLVERSAPTLIVNGLASDALLPMAAAAGFTHAAMRCS